MVSASGVTGLLVRGKSPVQTVPCSDVPVWDAAEDDTFNIWPPGPKAVPDTEAGSSGARPPKVL